VVRTEATGPRSIFPNTVAEIKTAAEKEDNGVGNMTANKCVKLQVHLSDAETEATTRGIANIDRIVSQLEREYNGNTSNQQMQFNK
jgi:hypothetical protein